MKNMKTIESSDVLDKKELHRYIDATEFDNGVREAIKGMLGVVLVSADDDINLDFDDFKTIMSHGKMAFVGSGEANGKNSPSKAIKQSIINSSLSNKMMSEVSGILIHFTIHPSLPLMEIAKAMDMIHENTNDNTDIIWGTTTDKSVSLNYVKVSALFAGVGRCKLEELEGCEINSFS